MKKNILIIVLIGLLIPFILNVTLQLPAVCSIVGDARDWLMFWPPYIGAIASFCMIYYTAKHYESVKDSLKK